MEVFNIQIREPSRTFIYIAVPPIVCPHPLILIVPIPALNQHRSIQGIQEHNQSLCTPGNNSDS